MEMTEKKNDLKSMMVESMEKVKEMVDANNIVGEPITTPDGVTLIPISRLSYGFGCGGGDYGKTRSIPVPAAARACGWSPWPSWWSRAA